MSRFTKFLSLAIAAGVVMVPSTTVAAAPAPAGPVVTGDRCKDHRDAAACTRDGAKKDKGRKDERAKDPKKDKDPCKRDAKAEGCRKHEDPREKGKKDESRKDRKDRDPCRHDPEPDWCSKHDDSKDKSKGKEKKDEKATWNVVFGTADILKEAKALRDDLRDLGITDAEVQKDRHGYEVVLTGFSSRSDAQDECDHIHHHHSGVDCTVEKA